MKKKIILASCFAALFAYNSCTKDDDKPDPEPAPNTDTTQTDTTNVKPNPEPTPDPKPAGTPMLHIVNNAVSKEAWHVQYHVAEGLGLKKGKTYEVTFKLKTSEPASLSYSVGSWYPDNFSSKIESTTEMAEYKATFEAVVDDGFIMFQTGDFVGDIWIENITITHKGSNKTQALTKEEKRDTLAWAMDHWIEGIMEATDGFVKAWDVVNEALSGGGNDGYGNYVLQHSSNPNDDANVVKSGNFFWQDYMGDLEYVRTAVASARKHFKGNPEDLKLFINDYNLESDWDDNGKVKSLVGWCKRWEEDGVTKIDGLGTQMHISCYEDANLQKSAEDHIVKMFQIMANSGKLVRVSELDMGYVRGNNKWAGSLKTNQVTAAEHQKMADFYEFILRKYFEIVPTEQQYGFCQWCTTDAPSNSGWRGGEPVGIWTQNYSARKAAFKGFAQGLAESELEGDVNDLNPLKTYVDRTKHPIFKFSGAIEAWDFNSNQSLRDTIAANFDEIVAGNSMKYASCVDGGGNLNFNTVIQFCEQAKAKNITIYGHTLAWHSQQQPSYLLGLMKPKELEVPDSEKVDITDCNINYSGKYNQWHGEYKNSENNVDYSIEIVSE